MMYPLLSRSRARSPRRWTAARWLAFSLALGSGGCRSAVDFVEVTRPATRSALELRLRPAAGDTVHAELLLGVGPTTVISSVSASLQLPSGLRFVACRAEQGAPLLVCTDGPDGVRFATSWATGAHTGALLSFLAIPEPAAAARSWKLTIHDIFGARGALLTDSIDVHIGGVQ